MAAEDRSESAGVVLWRTTPDGIDVDLALTGSVGRLVLPARRMGRSPASALATAMSVAAAVCAGSRLGSPGPRVETGGGRSGRRVYWPVEVQTPAPRSEDPEPVVRWVAAAEADEALARATDRRVVRSFLADRGRRRPVLIVRHARAGKRSRWSGRDDDRPLDRRGRAQAAALAGLLTHYQPERVHSSDAVRCLETVAPAAAALSLPIQADPLLGEVAALDNPGAARDTLARLVATPGNAVICGQRKSLDLTLPGLLETLGVTSKVAVPRKGGVLVLHLAVDGGRTVVEQVEPPA